MAVVHFAILTAIGIGRVPKVTLDFPHIWGPGAATGNTLHQAYPISSMGVWLEGDLAEYALVVVTEGLRSWGSQMKSTDGDTLQVAALIATAEESIGQNIHASADSEVLAAWADDVNTPVIGYDTWLPGEVISDSRWTRIKSLLVANGGDSTIIDNWRTKNPNATPQDFWVALKNKLN